MSDLTDYDKGFLDCMTTYAYNFRGVQLVESLRPELAAVRAENERLWKALVVEPC